jgi:protocatechuate 3,4-dioxygenase beta subunit
VPQTAPSAAEFEELRGEWPIRVAGVVETTSDAAGAFACDLPGSEAPFDLHVVARGHAPAVVGVNVQSDATPRIVLDDVRTVAGRVLDAGTGAPLAAAYVAVLDRRTFEQRERSGDRRPLGGAAQTRTDAGGRFRLDVGAGEMSGVEAWADGFLAARAWEAKPGDADVALGLAPSTSIAGRVFADGAPAAGVEVAIDDIVAVESDEGPRLRTTTRADGSFILRRLAPGPWRLAVQGDGDFALRKVMDVAGGDRFLRVELRPGRTIRGRVVDEQGRPLRAWLTADDIDAARVRASTDSDADGRFAFTRLDDGVHALSADADGFVSTQVDGVPAGAERVEIVLSRGLAVEGRVLDPDGRPIAVRTYDNVELASGGHDWCARGRTDADGRFRITGLRPGKHRFRLIDSAGALGFEAPPDLVVEAGAAGLEVRCVRTKR